MTAKERTERIAVLANLLHALICHGEEEKKEQAILLCINEIKFYLYKKPNQSSKMAKSKKKKKKEEIDEWRAYKQI